MAGRYLRRNGRVRTPQGRQERHPQDPRGYALRAVHLHRALRLLQALCGPCTDHQRRRGGNLRRGYPGPGHDNLCQDEKPGQADRAGPEG